MTTPHAHDHTATPDVTRTLVENHARFLAFLTPRLGSREAAEDVLQAALVKGLEKQDSVRDEESTVAWFFRLLRNAITDHYRRRGAEDRAIPRAAADAEAIVDDEPLRAEVCRCVHDLVPLLKPEYATMVRRVDLEGTPLQALATELEITPNNAAVRLHRARAALKKQLEASCGTCTEHGCLDCTCRD
ncbi:MAG: sigma-70 family RNA polymerase sigma factor [Planctomycetes bacterium]|nr:sigma-70 family RNA polymerase sigma factor [Planctomycetota bacterium]MCW8137618.1 sigma-70 family RNA polymerase sigma factor [Planctomycetota bacterium]